LVSAVLARGEHDEEAVGRQRHRREGPFGQRQRIVREEVSFQIEGRGVGILDFNQVRVLAVLVRGHARVVGNKLSNERIGGAERQHGQQRRQKQTAQDGHHGHRRLHGGTHKFSSSFGIAERMYILAPVSPLLAAGHRRCGVPAARHFICR
jgi:hypothetical protein